LYSIESHGLEGVITEDDYANTEQPFDAESDETIGLTNVLWTGKELALAAAMQDTSVMTENVTLAGTDQFNDYAASKPLEVFRDAQNNILSACGHMPNRAMISQTVFNTLKYHPSILRQLGYADARAGTLTRMEIAKALNVEILHVGNVAYDAGKLGDAAALSQVWGKDIIMYYAPKTPAKYQKSLGYYMVMKKRGPRRVFKFNINNPPNSKGIIVQDDYQFVFTDVKCGFLIKDAIA
jgi:hypothetical protein